MKARIPYIDTIEIDELTISTEAGDLVAVDFDVDVEFTFLRGYPAQTYGPAEDCEPGTPDEFDFEYVKAVGNVWFYNGVDDFPILKFADGDDLLPRLTEAHITMLEDLLLESVAKGESD